MSPSASPSTDSSLLRRVQTQDAAAWRQFVDLYGPLVFAWIRRAGLSSDDAADVTQETLIAVARSIASFRHDNPDSSLRGWLWTVALNKTRDWARQQRSGDQGVGGSEMHQRLLDVRDGLPETDTDESLQLTRLLHRGLLQVQAEFEPRTWQAFWIAVVEGRSTAAVAEQLGMTENYVRQCRSRILRRLREQLGES